MAKFDQKSFNPSAFGAYVKNVPNLNANALAKSGAVGTNEQAKTALSSQTGSLFATIPYFGRINGSTSQNNDGATDITSTNTTTYEQGFVVASRMDSWTERSFSKNITSGVDFMDNVAKQINEYKYEVAQGIMLAMLAGVYSMNTSGSTAKAKAAKAFVEGHTLDVAATGDGLVGATTLNKAIQLAGGDNKNAFKLVILHSAVATNLENLRLLEYMKYTDKDGIQQDLAIGTWNGRVVLVDDNMPSQEIEAAYVASADKTVDATKTYYTKSGSTYTKVASPTGDPSASSYFEKTSEAYTAYTTYVLGEDSIILDNIGDAVPYEMGRDPGKNGGQDTLYVRDRYICGLEGLSFVKPSSLTASASNTDLSTGANWEVINDGSNCLSHKAIPIARIISKG